MSEFFGRLTETVSGNGVTILIVWSAACFMAWRFMKGAADASDR